MVDVQDLEWTGVPVKPDYPRVKDMVSPQEWEARVNLAACYRLMHEYGMEELVANHITCPVPGRENEYLVNPFGMLYEEITASSLVSMTLDGETTLNVTSYPTNITSHVIHGSVYRARKDAGCVIHSHTLADMAVSAMTCGLLPIAQSSMRWGRGVSWHDYLSLAPDEGEQLVRDLGDNDAMFMRNHGVLVIGRSIPECFNNAWRLERACQIQVMALACNTELRYPTEELIQATYDMFQPIDGHRRLGILEWPSLLRKVDRIDPSYRY